MIGFQKDIISKSSYSIEDQIVTRSQFKDSYSKAIDNTIEIFLGEKTKKNKLLLIKEYLKNRKESAEKNRKPISIIGFVKQINNDTKKFENKIIETKNAIEQSKTEKPKKEYINLFLVIKEVYNRIPKAIRNIIGGIFLLTFFTLLIHKLLSGKIEVILVNNMRKIIVKQNL
jgi:hypothetical protein